LTARFLGQKYSNFVVSATDAKTVKIFTVPLGAIDRPDIIYIMLSGKAACRFVRAVIFEI